MSDNPFAAQSGGKAKFVMVKAFATPVKLVSGESYTIPGVLDREGNEKPFNGKQKVAKSDLFHVVFDCIARTKDGATYHIVKHYLSKDKDYGKVYPSYSKMFGEDLGRLAKDYTPLHVQETGLGRKFKGDDGNEIDLMWLKPIQVFADEKALRAAEEAYFSSNGSSGQDESQPASDSDTFNADEFISLLPEIENAIKAKTKELKSPAKALEFVLADWQLTPEKLEAIRAAAK